MKLIVGLGNPGREYQRTRHNAGFLALGVLGGRHAPGAPVKAKFHADVLEASISGEKCLLLAPTTYMNRSGIAVQEALAFYKLDPTSDLLVLTDDLALPIGKIRVRQSGSPGGHNGLKDISRVLGNDDYPRLRIGIDPKPPQMNQADYVLSRFTDEDIDRIAPAIQRAADATETFVEGGVTAAMNKFNAEPSSGSGWSSQDNASEQSTDDPAHVKRAPQTKESHK